MEDFIEDYYDNNKLVAIVFRNRAFFSEGTHFFTDPSLFLQFGYMNYPKGKIIPFHIHNKVLRKVIGTSEVLLIRSGQLKVYLLNNKGMPLVNFILSTGDFVIFYNNVGHGFRALTSLEVIEIKQGPYLGESDKRLL